jgi:alkylation response protein AidB-like acyl-CoA dehydrogenase
MATTTSERGLTLRSPGRFMASAGRLVDLYLHTANDSPDTAAANADAVVEAWMDADAYRLFVLATALKAIDGEAIGAESSANKLFWSTLDIDIHQTGLALLGERATLESDEVAARWLDGYQFALAGPIYAGTNEVQRNIIAERVLGLPRS